MGMLLPWAFCHVSPSGSGLENLTPEQSCKQSSFLRPRETRAIKHCPSGPTCSFVRGEASLVLPQRDERVDPRGAQSRNERGKKRNGQERRHDHNINREIGRRHTWERKGHTK